MAQWLRTIAMHQHNIEQMLKMNGKYQMSSLTRVKIRTEYKDSSSLEFSNKMVDLKSKLRTEKEQMSTPDPAKAVNIPPMRPVKTRTTASHTPKLTMLS